jgi:hypothetical protein
MFLMAANLHSYFPCYFYGEEVCCVSVRIKSLNLLCATFILCHWKEMEIRWVHKFAATVVFSYNFIFIKLFFGQWFLFETTSTCRWARSFSSAMSLPNYYNLIFVFDIAPPVITFWIIQPGDSFKLYHLACILYLCIFWNDDLFSLL